MVVSLDNRDCSFLHKCIRAIQRLQTPKGMEDLFGAEQKPPSKAKDVVPSYLYKFMLCECLGATFNVAYHKYCAGHR